MKIILFIFSFLIVFTHTVEAKYFSFNQLHKMPKSYEKDYYIWRFLQAKKTTKKEAKNIAKELKHINTKLAKAYWNKIHKSLSLNKPMTFVNKTANQKWKKRSKANKSFKMALALLKQRKPFQAVNYLNKAKKNYVKPYERDKTNFWLYLATNNTDYIKILLKSKQINIYTLIATETVKGSYPTTITESLWKKKSKNFNIKDPIAWAKIKDRLKEENLNTLANKYKSQECIGIYCYIKAKEANYTKTYFPMPYRNVMKYMTKRRQALIYAIARQESRFVPASVSRSFALGMMQFMPFLIKHVAKQKKEKIDLDAIFNPYKAIEYADYHLDYLTKYLYHPLFIAYAYNAGIGFTRKHLRNKHHFRKGAYEPYMSMETMKNEEAKEYGKKVLANYIIYMNKLGVKQQIFPLLKILATPSKTDKFRK